MVDDSNLVGKMVTRTTWERIRHGVAWVIALLVVAWAVFAFGTPMDIVIEGDFYLEGDDFVFEPNTIWPVRTVAAWATGMGGLLCLLLLRGKRGLPPLPRVFVIAATILLIHGWIHVLNAMGEYNSETWMVEEVPHWGWLWGTSTYSQSLAAMTELSLVLVGLLAVMRATETSAWRGLLVIVALAGVGVALTGIIHKAAQAPTIYWMEDASQPALSIFAPYVYNANAGAFMNISLALTMGLAFATVGDERRRAQGIVWAFLSVLLIAAVFVSASKGAILVMLMTVPLILSWNLKRVKFLVTAFRRERGRKIERLVLIGTMGVLMLSLAAIGVARMVSRWDEFVGKIAEGRADFTGRFEIMKVMAKMSAWDEGGIFGLGPRCFRYVVPSFTMEGTVAEGDWIFGHCDPLQTLAEWGWLGAACWFVIGIGAVVAGFLVLRGGRLGSSETPLVRSVIVALVMVGVHSCQDFPLCIFSIHLAAMLLCAVCWGLWAGQRLRQS